MHGEPLYGTGFKAFERANTAAPKGGRLIQGVRGTFDSVNPFIINGVPVTGVSVNVIETLLARSLDEPFSLYGLIAQSFEMPDDRSEIIFTINPAARFSDGQAITADDVLFSFSVLREKGRPNHRSYFKKVSTAEKLAPLRVRFAFEGAGDRELPLILGLMPILPAHLLSGETFEATQLAPFVGSGPYTMARIEPGRSVTYQRDVNYWGRDLPVNAGRFNFDELRFDYYRDETVIFEAFKNGEIDLRIEDNPALWAQGYDIPAVRDGRIVASELENPQPAPMMGLVFNTRRPLFSDPVLRRALTVMFDFEFANRSLFNGKYSRTRSFFDRSFLSTVGKPADGEEMRLLAPFVGQLDPDVMAGNVPLPVTDGSGRNRANLAKAAGMLAAAGYVTRDGSLLDPKTQKPVAFEILSSTPLDRLLAGFVGDLGKIGIKVTLRQVDEAQYQARLRTYDYDMIQATYFSSLSPGNEQTFRWSGRVAKQEGSFNYAGVDDPAVDAMISAMLTAKSSDTFVSAVRALDRVLLSGTYMIPLYYAPRIWVAHAARLRHPAATPLVGFTIDTWWTEIK